MKLAEIIANAHNSNFSEESFSLLRSEKNAKNVFTILRHGWSYQEKEYSAKCWEILDFVAKNVTGFQADIAEKAKFSGYEMSEKQTWCVSFAFINF